jgi:transcriptional regulator with XRE-family HTH domain
VASVGYGLGTQADDGTAVAGGDPSSSADGRPGGRPSFARGGQPPGFQDLANKLGVDAGKLGQAFRDFRASEQGDRRDEFATALAKALGIPADRVTAAFDRLHQRREARLATSLASALNVDADRVQAALDKLMRNAPRPPEEFAQALADELNVDVTDVRRALFESRAEPGHVHRRPEMPLRQLATALGVSRAELRKAFRELHNGAENGREQDNEALAKFLAKRFNLSANDVSKALAELPRPAPPGHFNRPRAGAPGMYPPPTPG